MQACRWCGKILTEERRPDDVICTGCRTQEAECFKKIKDTMLTNPGMNAMEIATKSRVPLAKVKYFVDNGKIKVRG